LLAAELEAASPRPCVWLDSGEAIARRVVHVLAASPGQARVQRAAFTSADGARASWRAFESRGFCAFSHIGVEPRFEVAPLTGLGTA
jgi:hypothetical protein